MDISPRCIPPARILTLLRWKSFRGAYAPARVAIVALADSAPSPWKNAVGEGANRRTRGACAPRTGRRTVAVSRCARSIRSRSRKTETQNLQI
jgi:hypothetical protein